MGADQHRLGYRGDIEGLRAIAILLVVAAHAKVSWLAGGFIGVDVFFVLSGYLITGVLLREMEQTGHLGFANFYARRFRRLLPALLVMLVCTSLAAVVVLPPAAQGDQAVAAATAAAWLSNIHFAFAKLDYFSPGAASNLFLHTWSLGVEEQFYLVWPALILLAFGASRKGKNRTKRLKVTMFVIAGISLAWCFLLTETASQMAFYMMPLRAWQFAAGALVWLYFGSPVDAGEATKARTTNTWIGWAGLALIAVAALWFNANMPYPGWRSLLPTLGAAAIIAVGAHGTSHGISRVLTYRPLQAVGRISYSWYLWHWPVLLLGGALVTTDSALYRAALVALSLLLAMAAYRWVESPIRHQARWVARPGVTILTAIGLMAAANVLCISWYNAAWNWLHTPTQQRYAQAHADLPIIYKMGCDDWYQSDQVRPCSFGPSDAKHTAVLMGDSIGAQWFPAVAAVFDRPDWRLLVLTKSSCPMVDETIFYPRIGRDYTECTTWRTHALQQVAAWRPDILILGSVQTYDLSQTQWLEGTTRLLRSIDDSVGHTYILRGTPHLTFDGPNCLSAQSWLPKLYARQAPCRAPAFSQQNDDVFLWQQQAAARFGNVTALDMNQLVCPNGECAAERGDMVVYRDSQHLTASFVQSLSGELAQKLHLDRPMQHPAGEHPSPTAQAEAQQPAPEAARN